MELEAYLTLIVVVLVALVYLVFSAKKLVLWGMTRPNSFLKGLSVLNLVGASVLAILVTQFYDRPKDYGAPPLSGVSDLYASYGSDVVACR